MLYNSYFFSDLYEGIHIIMISLFLQFSMAFFERIFSII